MTEQDIFELIIKHDNHSLSAALTAEDFDYTVTDEKGDTFLHCAARVNNPAAVEVLLKKGKSALGEKDSGGYSVLMTACAWRSLDVTELLLDKYIFYFDINEPNEDSSWDTPFALLNSNSGSALEQDRLDKREELLKKMICFGAVSDFFAARRKRDELLETVPEEIIKFKPEYYEQAEKIISNVQPVDSLTRFAMRKAYHTLAEKALEENELKKAKENIDLCFQTVDLSVDKPAFFDQYFITAANICKKLSEQDSLYEKSYIDSLQTLIDNNVFLTDDKLTADISQYQLKPEKKFTYAENQPKVRTENETFLEAVKRYVEITGESEDTVSPPISAKELEEINEKLPISIPKSLADFYLNHANGLRNGDWPRNFFTLHGASSYHYTLIDAIQDWYGIDDEEWEEQMDEFIDLEPEQIEFIKNNYEIFASFLLHEDIHFYFFYGKNGKMGVTSYTQDGSEFDYEMLNPELPLLKYDSFDELFSKFFQYRINEHLGWKQEREEFIMRILETIM